MTTKFPYKEVFDVLNILYFDNKLEYKGVYESNMRNLGEYSNKSEMISINAQMDNLSKLLTYFHELIHYALKDWKSRKYHGTKFVELWNTSEFAQTFRKNQKVWVPSMKRWVVVRKVKDYFVTVKSDCTNFEWNIPFTNLVSKTKKAQIENTWSNIISFS